MAYTPEIGQRFGRLVVVEVGLRIARNDGQTQTASRCICDCGAECMAVNGRLRRGEKTSCGCRKATTCEENRPRPVHGESRHARNTPEYGAWEGMKNRCYRPGYACFARYGGRGITVCERWRTSYEAFLADVGRRPGPGYSLDRYPNPDGHYEPGNVRWATATEQARNRGAR